MSDLLELAMEAHGGLARWRDIQAIDLKMTIGGGLWRTKGHPAGLRDVALHIEPKRQFVSIAPFETPDRIGHFTPDRVWIDNEDGRLIEERHAPRRSFDGHRTATPWDDLHALYFVGYALSNYLATPFMFIEPGFSVEELEPHRETNATWRRLKVTFPSYLPTHCAEQVFFFSEQGILQRINYTVDIIGNPVAHYCFDPVSFGGLLVPTLRRVVGRTSDGPALSGPTIVLLQISDVVVA